jgi:dTDP-4-dehydrorhamnose reductase
MQNRTRCVLIVGGSGFLGTQLALKLRDQFKVFATYHKHTTRIPGVSFIPFDVSKKDWIKRVIFTAQPEVVIYVAGNPNLDWCSEHTIESEKVHLDGPSTLAIITGMIQPRFIFLSNPYVFDGTQGNYHESDVVLPMSVLGRMKSGAENVIRSKCSNYIILRCSPIIGRGNGKNLSMMDRLRMALERNHRFEASDQEYHGFVPIQGFLEVMGKLIESGMKNKIIHYGGLTKITPYEFAKLFAERFGYDTSLIAPKARVKNPLFIDPNMNFDYSLNFTQCIESLKIQPLLLEQSLDLIQEQLIPR